MNQPTDQCAICNQQPQDMLILVCAHNLCLDCATQLFTASSNHNYLQCQICLSTTPLDQETINCLKNLADKDLGQAYEAVQYPILPKPNIKRNQWECIQHSQVSMYYCVECNDIRICSECILAKKHLNHKVMTIKKAAVFLLQRIQLNMKDLQTSKIGLKESQQYLLGVKQKMMSEYEQKQNNLKHMFETIMRNIQYKYNQLKSQIEALSKRSFQMIDGTLNRIKQKEQNIDLQIKSNKQVLSNKNQDEVFLRCMQFENYKQTQQLSLPQLSMANFNIPPFSLSYHQIIKDFDKIILKIKWSQENKSTKVRQNDMLQTAKNEFLHNLNEKRIERYQQQGNQNMGYGWQNSLQKYSGIKGGNSRRLEMSRSIDNATNIINKLQERIKK